MDNRLRLYNLIEILEDKFKDRIDNIIEDDVISEEGGNNNTYEFIEVDIEIDIEV